MFAFFHSVDLCPDGAKAMVGKTASALLVLCWSNAKPQIMLIVMVLTSVCSQEREETPLSLKCVFDETVKMITFMKSLLLISHLFEYPVWQNCYQIKLESDRAAKPIYWYLVVVKENTVFIAGCKEYRQLMLKRPKFF